ncbi:hypothetical protein K474DRAFT_1017596 [Panus rudis PR-1116 ss-1]|nr:hypothetical protein K474DRAFT_1017596 [Panus rudis PR-1116 ss-1]
MQQPTIKNVRIRSTADAQRVLHAVRLGMLHMVHRRLDEQERLALRPGCVYVWEERSNNPLEVTGQEIQRFTEGRSWGPSRAREDFLLYNEKECAGRGSMAQRMGGLEPQGFVKQTYSAFIDSPKNCRKWHINAYFTLDTVDDLLTVDDIPELRKLQVPDGLYIPARAYARRTRSTHRSKAGSSSLSPISGAQPHSPSSARSEPTPRSSPIPIQSTLCSTARAHATGSPLHLAPLEYLQNITPPSRAPFDDEALRQFHGVSRV